MADAPKPKHAGGRPRVDPRQPSVDVHVTLPATTYDRAYAIASARDMSVPELLRRTFDRALPPARDPETSR